LHHERSNFGAGRSLRNAGRSKFDRRQRIGSRGRAVVIAPAAIGRRARGIVCAGRLNRSSKLPMNGNVMTHPPRQAPMTNTERQRKFRAAHPGYYNKYNARRRDLRLAVEKKVQKILQELFKIRAAEYGILQPAQPAAQTKPVLMLPAPAQDPTMAEIDALRASFAIRDSREQSKVPLPRHSADTAAA
jgi:hypothetical protein